MDSNCAVYDIPETFSAMRFGVESRSFHVRYCIYHFNFFPNMKFMESSDQDVKRAGLGSDSICQESFNCFLFILVYFWWMTYGVTNWSIEVSDQILIQHSCVHCSYFCIGTASRSLRFFLEHQSVRVSFNIWTVELTARLPDRFFAWSASQYTWRQLEYSWFLYLCIPCFEETLMLDFICFGDFTSWVHDRFMWMVHQILNAISESKEIRFCWGIDVSTDTHGNILKTIASLNTYVHEATNPVIEVSFMWFLNFFHFFSNKGCSYEECLFKKCVHQKRWFLELYSIFCICSPIFLNNVFGDVIFIGNTELIFILNYANF